MSGGKAWRPGGQHSQAEVPLLLRFLFWFLRLVYFLSLLPVTPGTRDYRLFSPWAVSFNCFLTLHLGFSLCICVWPGESRSDPSFTASCYSGIWLSWLNLFHVISAFKIGALKFTPTTRAFFGVPGP